MQLRAGLLFLGLTSFTLLQVLQGLNIGLQDQKQSLGEDLVLSVQKEVKSRPWSRPDSVKEGAGLTEKLLLRLDGPQRTENEVMEPKRKRGFSGSSAPLDRLSVSSNNKPSKVPEAPRRRLSPAPIDRIGTGRLPGNRG